MGVSWCQWNGGVRLGSGLGGMLFLLLQLDSLYQFNKGEEGMDINGGKWLPGNSIFAIYLFPQSVIWLYNPHNLLICYRY